MSIRNIEIKAKISDKKYFNLESWLLANGADYKGVDNQVDHYFKVKEGRLKLRTGNIENSLIYYERQELKDLKTSNITLAILPQDPIQIVKVLNHALGSKVVVSKTRKIFFIENVKFHLDMLDGLGYFCEIEAISIDNKYNEQYLKKQCQHYLDAFGIDNNDLVDGSYSDMLEVNSNK